MFPSAQATAPDTAPTTLPRPWQQRYLTPAVTAAWALTGAGTPWLPARVHTLLVGLCVAGTVAAVWYRSQVPVRAAYLEGMIFGQATARQDLEQPFPRAVGDDNVTPFNPQRRRPPPRR